MKHVYRAVIFMVFFLGTVAIFSSRMKESQGADSVQSVEPMEASFPVITIVSQDYQMNLLHGYNSNLKASLNRESMTPIGNDRSMELNIEENAMTVRKIKYELHKVNDNNLMASGEISVFDKIEKGKKATLSLGNDIEQGKEYALKMTLVTKDGMKIHYFTHVKFYAESNLQVKMDFINTFHESTLDTGKLDGIAGYLESYVSELQEDEDLAHVNITSSKQAIGWGDLKPNVVSNIIPTIKEYNTETAAVCLDYYVKIKGQDKKSELCKVKEFLRVRYSGGRMYLLKYERDFYSVFSKENIDVKNGKFDLGVTDEERTAVTYSEDRSRMAWSKDGELWEYSTTENSLNQVFSFRRDSEDYTRACYDQHDVRIVKLSDDGNLDFLVYGYMNSGDYEGCVGILWYKYYEADQRVEEQVFIPMDTTYQILKENLDDFSCVNSANVLFFCVDGSLYYYDQVAKQLRKIAENMNESKYCYVKSAGVLAWQMAAKDKEAACIQVMDLETKKERTVRASNEETIELIGSIDENIVYGVAKTVDISENNDGTTLTPMYKVCIADREGNVLKEYKKKNIYVTKASIENNVVKMSRVSGSKGNFKEVSTESIQSQSAQSTEYSTISSTTFAHGLQLCSLGIPNGKVMTKKPTIVSAKQTLIMESSIVRLEIPKTVSRKYYVYAEGVILAAYDSPNKAIEKAEEAMGTVISHNNQIVYERAGKYTNNAIGSIEAMGIGNGINTKGACLSIVLKYNHLEVDAKTLSESKQSVYGLLKSKLGKTVDVVNLKGCTLDEVLYFVSGGKPVVAMTSGGAYVVITEYTESTVTFINPANGKKETKGIAAMTKEFEAAGNTFVSYV